MAKNKYEFSFDVSELTTFKNENQPLMAEMLFTPVTIASGIDVIVGEKATFKLNSLSNDIYLQASSCGWTSSGSSNFGQEEIVVDTLDLKESLCPKDLTTKWMSQLMKDGANVEEVPFEGFIVDSKTKKLSTVIEKMYWQGNKTTGTGNLALVDGMEVFLNEKTSIFVEQTGATTISNVIDRIDAIVNAIPEEILDLADLAIYVGSDIYRTYVNALLKSQYPVSNESQNKPYGKSFMIPGYNIEIVMTPGLTGTGDIYASSKENFVFATDLTSDLENMDIWYSKDNDEIRIKSSFRMGVGVHFPELVVHNNADITVV